MPQQGEYPGTDRRARSALFRHLARHRGALVLAAVLLAAGAAVPGASVLLLERGVRGALGGDPRWLAAFVAVTVAGAVAGVARTAVTKAVALRTAADLRCAVHDRWLRDLPSDEAVGPRLAALTSEADEVQYGVSALVTAARNPLAVAGLAISAVTLAPGLAPWALLLVPAVWWPSVWGGRRVHVRAHEAREARAAMLETAREQLEGVVTVRDFVAEDTEATRFERAADADRRARVGLEVERVAPTALVQVGVAVAVALLLWAGGRQIAAGTLEPSAFVGFAVAIGLMNRPLQGLSEVWTLWRRSEAGLARIEAALAEVALVPAPARPRDLPDGALSVAWEGVGLTLGRPVLRGVDLAVQAGEWVLVVGPTGAGKSTMLGLVGRHRAPSVGVVRVGGIDVREVNPATLRRQVAVVRQEPVLFARTLAENLRLGRPEASDADLADAAHRAGIDDLVERGWDASVAGLSGGERQRVALARALVAGGRIWLLDEPTGQVDARTTQVVLRALAERPRGTTVIMVAHDLAATAWADRIAVVEAGRVVEEGPHEALLARHGRYAALWGALAEGA